MKLINDDKDNIYLARLKKYENKEPDIGDENFKKFVNKQNSNSKKSILKSYDILLSEKYEIVLNQKTIERIRNIFQ